MEMKEYKKFDDLYNSVKNNMGTNVKTFVKKRFKNTL
jgi:hypothetical protein